jgi:GTP-binding protein EngB required for normal cell division
MTPGDSFESLHGEVENFLQRLCSAGWCQIASAEQISGKRGAADLFHQSRSSRPLVVGLFGGTGVGKSTLLNRLAGSDIAKTGVVRPTSLEITAYLHEQREVDALPDSFSVSNFNCVKHRNDQYRDVMWVDMPDFDSDETQNRDQVLQWLPHIDLLIYVVTPERYKDEQGWKLLVTEGYRHGWLFVMNQWDKAEASQMQDFKRLLNDSGFRQPKVFKTIGIERESTADEFELLAELVAAMAERNTVEQLEQVGWFRRLEEAQRLLAEQLKVLAPPSGAPVAVFDRHWEAAEVAVTGGLDIPFTQFASKFAADRRSPLKNALAVVTGDSADASQHELKATAGEARLLWDDWSQVKLSDAIAEFELATRDHGIPVERLKRLRTQVDGPSLDRIGEHWPEAVRKTLSNPGRPWQQTLQVVLGWLKVILPLAALGWVVSRVITGFINGASDAAAYVGTDFLTNGLLLVLLAWVLPVIAAYLTRPSLPNSVTETLHHELKREMTQASDEYRAALQRLSKERKEYCAEAQALEQKVASSLSRSAVLTHDDVRALLIHTPQVK